MFKVKPSGNPNIYTNNVHCGLCLQFNSQNLWYQPRYLPLKIYSSKGIKGNYTFKKEKKKDVKLCCLIMHLVRMQFALLHVIFMKLFFLFQYLS